MSQDFAVEYAETEKELSQKVEKRLQEGYELFGNVGQGTMKQNDKSSLTVFYQCLIKYFPALQD